MGYRSTFSSMSNDVSVYGEEICTCGLRLKEGWMDNWIPAEELTYMGMHKNIMGQNGLI